MSSITSQTLDFSRWYLDLLRECNVAEQSEVPGCMVIKPRGYAIWEEMQRVLDGMFKATGHQNAYFPLFIPKSYLAKEAETVQGFAKECAVVTHHRLKMIDGVLQVDPDAKLPEPLVVRPTSETIIWKTFRNWIKSHRDLPLLINQWANVVRWEMRTRMFLRTSEFLWQEGHTAHRTDEEAEEEAWRMIQIYRTFVEEWLAIPAIVGKKTKGETFPGARHSYTIELMLRDKKALQGGTSHHLGTTFADAFEVSFLDIDNKTKPVWATSWGVSTRLIGGLIMVHGDDRGLVIPPKIARTQVCVIPIWKTDSERVAIMAKSMSIQSELDAAGISASVLSRADKQSGWKFVEAERSGIPLRIEIGPRDLEAGKCILVRRDDLSKEESLLSALIPRAKAILHEIQISLLEKARAFRDENTKEIASLPELVNFIQKEGGFAKVFLDLACSPDERIRELRTNSNEPLGATIRCVLLDKEFPIGNCILTGKQTGSMAIVAKAI